ncbi:hypothetical protein K525DRAFT_245477, partial [Schizophyllum commune Loenen D]
LAAIPAEYKKFISTIIESYHLSTGKILPTQKIVETLIGQYEYLHAEKAVNSTMRTSAPREVVLAAAETGGGYGGSGSGFRGGQPRGRGFRGGQPRGRGFARGGRGGGAPPRGMSRGGPQFGGGRGRGQSRETRRCFRCNQVGHISRDCPNHPGEAHVAEEDEDYAYQAEAEDEVDGLEGLPEDDEDASDAVDGLAGLAEEEDEGWDAWSDTTDDDMPALQPVSDVSDFEDEDSTRALSPTSSLSSYVDVEHGLLGSEEEIVARMEAIREHMRSASISGDNWELCASDEHSEIEDSPAQVPLRRPDVEMICARERVAVEAAMVGIDFMRSYYDPNWEGEDFEKTYFGDCGDFFDSDDESDEEPVHPSPTRESASLNMLHDVFVGLDDLEFISPDGEYVGDDVLSIDPTGEAPPSGARVDVYDSGCSRHMTHLWKYPLCKVTYKLQPPCPGISPATPPGSARCGRRPPELAVRAFPSVTPPPAARVRN